VVHRTNRPRATKNESGFRLCSRVAAGGPVLSVFLFVQEMQRRQHDRVQDANDQDLAVKRAPQLLGRDELFTRGAIR
jgi:hypothetical protein